MFQCDIQKDQQIQLPQFQCDNSDKELIRWQCTIRNRSYISSQSSQKIEEIINDQTINNQSDKQNYPPTNHSTHQHYHPPYSFLNYNLLHNQTFFLLPTLQKSSKQLQQVMNYSIPKGRNFSKQNLGDKKYYGVRHSEKTNFFSLLTSGTILQEKSANKPPMGRRESDDLLVKRTYSNQALKPIGSYMQTDNKYSQLNKKIKDILDQDELGGRQAVKQTETVMNRSSILKRVESSGKQQFMSHSVMVEKRDNQGTNLPNPNFYFLECLKRKNSITTQFYINIHTSILTFKQFYKLAHQCKPKIPDTTISPATLNRKTIVFDMDETLIHTSEVMTPGYEIKVPFKAFQGKVSSGFVNVRPYAKQLLKKLSKHFDIIVFTAGNKCYADPILDHIDPTGVIQHRLYRQSCTFVANQLFVKDLRIIGRPLEQLVLVDNAPHSYMLQLANGVPILNYFKGKEDNQLYYLEKYLMGLVDVEDVRVVNAEYFRLHEYMKFDSHDKLISALYAKKVAV